MQFWSWKIYGSYSGMGLGWSIGQYGVWFITEVHLTALVALSRHGLAPLNYHRLRSLKPFSSWSLHNFWKKKKPLACQNPSLRPDLGPWARRGTEILAIGPLQSGP